MKTQFFRSRLFRVSLIVFLLLVGLAFKFLRSPVKEESVVSKSTEAPKSNTQNPGAPTESLVDLEKPENSIASLVTCLENESCVEGPMDDLAFYEKTNTESFLKLKDLLQIVLDEKQFERVKTTELLKVVDFPDGDLQILATQILIEKKIQVEDWERYRKSFPKFESVSMTSIMNLYFNQAPEAKLFNLAARQDVLSMAAEWLGSPNNSPLEFLESGVLEKLETSEKEILAKSLCRFKTDKALKNVYGVVSSYIDLGQCS
jgi:hypothetical protein